jgi:hypothetical protein
VKSPNVRTLIGSVKSKRKGLITALTTPKIRATKSPDQKPLTLAPDISQALMRTAAVLINHVMSNFIYFIINN